MPVFYIGQRAFFAFFLFTTTFTSSRRKGRYIRRFHSRAYKRRLRYTALDNDVGTFVTQTKTKIFYRLNSLQVNGRIRRSVQPITTKYETIQPLVIFSQAIIFLNGRLHTPLPILSKSDARTQLRKKRIIERIKRRKGLRPITVAHNTTVIRRVIVRHAGTGIEEHIVVLPLELVEIIFCVYACKFIFGNKCIWILWINNDVLSAQFEELFGSFPLLISLLLNGFVFFTLSIFLPFGFVFVVFSEQPGLFTLFRLFIFSLFLFTFRRVAIFSSIDSLCFLLSGSNLFVNYNTVSIRHM